MAFCNICHYDTIEEEFDICPVCFWEHEDIPESEFGKATGGPNADLSVITGRENFKKFGATQKRLLAYVVPPKRDWKHAADAESREVISKRQEAARARHGIKAEKLG